MAHPLVCNSQTIGRPLLFQEHDPITSHMKTTATYDSAAGTFTIEKGIWRGTFPITELPKWVNFYRGQMERYESHAANYAPDVEALEALARQIGAKLR